MPLSALPPELRDVENHFPDDDQFGTNWFGRLYRWYQKSTKTWFCFSSRCPEWWARWRKYPKVLFAIKSKQGYFRFEANNTRGPSDCAYDACYLFNEYVWHIDSSDPNVDVFNEGYLSRVQYWCRWHFAIQWPLMISFHFYPKAADVPKYNEPCGDTDGKLWFFYWGHYDNDLVYWMFTSIYLGRVWK
jgi:hypothetical protein